MASSRPVATKRPSSVHTLCTAKPRTTTVTRMNMVTPFFIVAVGLLFLAGSQEGCRCDGRSRARAGRRIKNGQEQASVDKPSGVVLGKSGGEKQSRRVKEKALQIATMGGGAPTKARRQSRLPRGPLLEMAAATHLSHAQRGASRALRTQRLSQQSDVIHSRKMRIRVRFGIGIASSDLTRSNAYSWTMSRAAAGCAASNTVPPMTRACSALHRDYCLASIIDHASGKSLRRPSATVHPRVLVKTADKEPYREAARHGALVTQHHRTPSSRPPTLERDSTATRGAASDSVPTRATPALQSNKRV